MHGRQPYRDNNRMIYFPLAVQVPYHVPESFEVHTEGRNAYLWNTKDMRFNCCIIVGMQALPALHSSIALELNILTTSHENSPTVLF
ncbi:hypothetical protein I7I48_00488 [Histoplasma ohiense]|nr:hypothetical protein I7I48_00488 [Histoplasma ohiense (nom. inval.)]